MSTQKINIQWQGKRQFLATATNGHQVLMDGPLNAGGEDAGIRPMEMILQGLAGCSAFDVVSIIEKKKIKLESCQVTVSATRSPNIPAVFEHIHLHFFLQADGLTQKAAHQAVSLSVDKYCSVAAMLVAGDVKIDYEVTVTSVI